MRAWALPNLQCPECYTALTAIVRDGRIEVEHDGIWIHGLNCDNNAKIFTMELSEIPTVELREK